MSDPVAAVVQADSGGYGIADAIKKALPNVKAIQVDLQTELGIRQIKWAPCCSACDLVKVAQLEGWPRDRLRQALAQCR